jgi:hypothetical protein
VKKHTRLFAIAAFAAVSSSAYVSAAPYLDGGSVAPEATLELLPRPTGWSWNPLAPVTGNNDELVMDFCQVFFSQPGLESLYEKFRCDLYVM